MDAHELDDLWESQAVARHLGVPLRTLDQWAYQGKGPAFLKVGRFRRYPRAELAAWLRSLPKGGDGA